MIKAKKDLFTLLIFVAIWYAVSLLGGNDTYLTIGVSITAIWIVTSDFLKNSAPKEGLTYEEGYHKSNTNISNYLVEILILIYILVELFYNKASVIDRLIHTVFLYILLQKILDFGFAKLSSIKFEKLRLEEELDKEGALLLTMALHQLAGYYSVKEFFISNTDSSLLIISLVLSFYSGVKVFLETQNKNSQIRGLDESEDNGTLGISSSSFCSRELQDKYRAVAKNGKGNSSYRAVAYLNLASIFKKIGLYKKQLKWLNEYKKLKNQLNLNSSDAAIISSKLCSNLAKGNLTDHEKHLKLIIKKADVERLTNNFSRDLIECRHNVESLSSKPTKGFLTILRVLLIVFVILTILHLYGVIDILLVESATAGSISLGALFFIFKDFSFSIFSGLRIYMDNLFSVGDKLRLDEFNITGKVINFNPSTVEIRSSDNSITKIYMHKIVASTFTNLSHRKKRGRYINLTLNIDVNSIINIDSDPDLKENLSRVFLLKRYLKCKKNDIQNSKDSKTRKEFRDNIKREFYKDNEKIFGSDSKNTLNTRNITNIGTFREYVFRYLSNHNLLDNDQYIMARQLQPSDTGAIIEIKAYTEVQYSNKRDYERIYSDIVEHLIVTLPEFKLALFQGEASSGRKIDFS